MTPKGPLLLYSSINSVIHLVDTAKNQQIPFDLSLSPTLSTDMKDNLRILSVKFCEDGSELLAGCTGGKLCL